MLRKSTYIASTPNFSSDIDLESWLREQEWYDSSKEYIAVYDSEWGNHDIRELL